MHDLLLPRSTLRRTINSFRHPDQAALLARVPLAGRRVPARGFWRRQPLSARRMAGHARASAADCWRYTRQMAPRLGRGSIAPVLLAGAAGALALYYADPAQGRRRRALVRDRLARWRRVVTRDVPRRAERRARFLGGVARGVGHGAASFARGDGYAGDETLVARVRSEVLRSQQVKAGEVHVDAYEGCVTLRGQLEHPEDIRRLVHAAGCVDGVREVRSFLHLPGTPPPNKGDVYGPVPQHLAVRTD
jgi:hypothetical protein